MGRPVYRCGLWYLRVGHPKRLSALSIQQATWALCLRTRLKFLVEYFQNIKLSAPSARMMLAHVDTGLLIATNNPTDPTVHTNSNGSVQVASLADVRDSLLQRTVSHYGTSKLLTCATPCQFTHGEGLDYDIVLVKSVYEGYELRLRVVVVVPSSDFLQEVQSSLIGSVIGASVAVVVVLIISILAACELPNHCCSSHAN